MDSVNMQHIETVAILVILMFGVVTSVNNITSSPQNTSDSPHDTVTYQDQEYHAYEAIPFAPDDTVEHTEPSLIELEPEYYVHEAVHPIDTYEFVPSFHICNYNVCNPNCHHVPQPQGPSCEMCQQLGCGNNFDVEWNKFCSCDILCVFHGDCCGDFPEVCPEIYSEALDIQAKASHIPKPECILIHGVNDVSKVKLVASCGSKSCPIDSSGDGNVDQYPHPVMDLDTKISYVSLDCARCNGATNIQGWDSTLECGLDYDPVGVERKQLNQWITDGTCFLRMNKPRSAQYCISNFEDECSLSTCSNVETINACHNGSTQYVNFHGWMNFRNFHCALCNLNPNEDMTREWQYLVESGNMCGVSMALSYVPPHSKGDGPSLTILFDFNYSDGETISDVSTRFICAGDYGLVNGHCIQMYCPQGWQPNMDLCSVHFVKGGFVNFAVKLMSSNAFSLPPAAMEHFRNELRSKLRFSEMCTVGFHGIPDVACEAITPILNDTFDIVYSYRCFFSYKVSCEIHWTIVAEADDVALRSEISERGDAIQKNLTDELASEITTYVELNFDVLYFQITSSNGNKPSFSFPLYGANETVVIPNVPGFEVTQTFPLINKSVIVTDCLRVKLSADMFEVFNDTLKVDILSEEVPGNQFVIENDTALVCKDFYEQHYDTKLVWMNRESSAMKITSVVALSLSVVSLLVRLLLQPFVSVFNTFPTKLQFCLCLTLCVSFLLFLLAPQTVDIPSLCYAFGALIHWGFLATFFCMMAVALHMFRTFRPSAIQQPKSSLKLLLFYLILAWLSPSVIVTISITLDFLPVSPYFQPQYGAPACWIGGKFAHLVYFGIPLAVVLLINIGLLIGTSVNLHRAFNTSASVNTRSKSYELKLNVKLAVLIGGTWVVAFIASAVNHEIMWYIFIILCGLQGVFVFVSMVCTKQVWDSLKERYSDYMPHSTSSSKPKTASTVVKSTVNQKANVHQPPVITVSVEGCEKENQENIDAV